MSGSLNTKTFDWLNGLSNGSVYSKKFVDGSLHPTVIFLLCHKKD